MKEKSLWPVVIVAIIITIIGCIILDWERLTDVDIRNQMAQHLEDKYGIIIYRRVGFIPYGWDHNYHLWNLEIETDGAKERLFVKGYPKKWGGGYDYYDNYFGYVMRDEVEAEISSIAKEYFENFKVYMDTESTTYPNELKEGDGFEEFLKYKDEIEYISIFIIVDNNQKDFHNNSKIIYDLWNEYGIDTNLRIFSVNKDFYDKIDRSNYLDVFDNEYVEFHE